MCVELTVCSHWKCVAEITRFPDCHGKPRSLLPVPPLPGGSPLPQLQSGKGATACCSSAAGDLGWPVAFCFVLPWDLRQQEVWRLNGSPCTHLSASGMISLWPTDFTNLRLSHILSVNVSVLPLTCEVIFTLHTKIWYYSWLGQNVLITMFSF